MASSAGVKNKVAAVWGPSDRPRLGSIKESHLHGI